MKKKKKKLIRNTRWHLLGSVTIIGAWISCFDGHVTQGEIEGKTSEFHHFPNWTEYFFRQLLVELWKRIDFPFVLGAEIYIEMVISAISTSYRL